jgi:hypothetical protein
VKKRNGIDIVRGMVATRALKKPTGTVVPVLNHALPHENIWGSGRIDSRFPDLSI